MRLWPVCAYGYDPTTGQFLTRDPLEALTRSPYAYVSNNPINGTDPTGLCGPFGDGGCPGGSLVPDSISDAVGDATDPLEDSWDSGYRWSRDHLDEVSDVASYVSFVGYAVCPVAAAGCVVGQAGAWVSAGASAGYAALNCGSSLDANCASALISMNVAGGGLLPRGWIANAAYDFGVTFPWMIFSRRVLPTLTGERPGSLDDC